MPSSNTFIIAREGWGLLTVLIGLFLFFALIDAELLQAITFFAAAGTAWIFRNPERIIPFPQEKSILSPCDGKIASIETIEEADNSFFKVTIVSECWECSILRIPFESSVTALNIQRGARLGRSRPLAPYLNENAVIEFSDDNHNKMIVEHVLEQSFSPLSIQMYENSALVQGRRYGVMLQGSTTMYLPHNSRVALNVGDKVLAGQTLIGYFS